MSIILNALRKSEQERKALAPEQPTAVPLTPLKSAPPRKRINPLLIFGVINLLAFGYLFFKLGQPAKTLVAPLVTATPPIAQPDKQAPTVIAAAQPLKPALENPKAISDLWAENKKLKANEALKALSAKPKEPVKKKEPAIVAPKETDIEIKPEPENQTAEIRENVVAMNPEPVPEATPALPKAITEKPLIKPNRSENLPLLRELSPDFQAKVPVSTLNVLAYSDQPNNRFVIIDMIKYKIGQQVKGKINLLNILPESVVLNFEGQNFRLERP